MVAKPRASKRVSILDAAEVVFIREGYDGASMDRIAEGAKASKTSVYNHFKSKEELFRAVMVRFLEERVALDEMRYDSEASLETQLGDVASQVMAAAQDPSWMGLAKTMTAVAIHQPHLVSELLASKLVGEDALTGWLRAASDDGRLTVTDPSLVARVFWSVLTGAFILPALFGTLGPKSELEAIKTELLSLMLDRYRA